MITDGVFSAYRRSLNRIPLAVFFATTLFFIGAASARAQLPSHLPPPSDPNSPSASAPPNTNDDSEESSSVAPPPDSNSGSSSDRSGDSNRSPGTKQPGNSGDRAHNPPPPPGTTPPADEDDADDNSSGNDTAPSGAGKSAPSTRAGSPPAPGESSSSIPGATRDPESEPASAPNSDNGRTSKQPLWKRAIKPSDHSSGGNSAANAKDGPDYNPLHAQESIDIGTYYEHKGDLAAAAERYKYAIELQPGLAKPHLLLAKLSERQRDKAAAVRYYQEYLAILPRAPDAQKIRSRILELQRQTK